MGLALVIAASAVMNTVRLSQNGYANIFYSAGVRSMIRSWHNFLFVSFDSGGLVSVDKPPLALWAQAASAKVFGFSPAQPAAATGADGCGGRRAALPDHLPPSRHGRRLRRAR